MKKIVFRAVLSLLALIGATAAAANTIEFATTKIGDFELSARTEYKWDADQPYIEMIHCEGSNNDFVFDILRDGTLQYLMPSFLDFPDENGNRADITTIGDALWLYVDNRRYEFRKISTPTSKFANYDYPPTQKANTTILPIWHGYKAVREAAADPFMNLNRIYGEIIAAKKLEWGFKSRNWRDVDRSVPGNRLPAGWETRRYPIDNTYLREAIDWCTFQVASETAINLPDELQ